VSLPAVLTAVLSTVDDLATARSVQIHLVLEPTVPAVRLSSDLLRHALLELLSYVLERAAGGELELRVTSNAEGVLVLLTSSAGEPEPPDDPNAPSGWEQDFRLIVCKRLLEMQGGSLESVPRSPNLPGFFLRLCLPSAREATVLVIDDDVDFTLLLQRYLRGHPYHVLLANTAERAFQLAREQPPRIVLLDVLMPSQDGWDVLRRLRRIEETRTVPIVICSVLSDRALAESLGASALLPKPVTQRAVLAMLTSLQPERGDDPGLPGHSGRSERSANHPPGLSP
jgi:CheY-like chemotaxis protein